MCGHVAWVHFTILSSFLNCVVQTVREDREARKNGTGFSDTVSLAFHGWDCVAFNAKYQRPQCSIPFRWSHWEIHFHFLLMPDSTIVMNIACMCACTHKRTHNGSDMDFLHMYVHKEESECFCFRLKAAPKCCANLMCHKYNCISSSGKWLDGIEKLRTVDASMVKSEENSEYIGLGWGLLCLHSTFECAM